MIWNTVSVCADMPSLPQIFFVCFHPSLKSWCHQVIRRQQKCCVPFWNLTNIWILSHWWYLQILLQASDLKHADSSHIFATDVRCDIHINITFFQHSAGHQVLENKMIMRTVTKHYGTVYSYTMYFNLQITVLKSHLRFIGLWRGEGHPSHWHSVPGWPGDMELVSVQNGQASDKCQIGNLSYTVLYQPSQVDCVSDKEAILPEWFWYHFLLL